MRSQIDDIADLKITWKTEDQSLMCSSHLLRIQSKTINSALEKDSVSEIPLDSSCVSFKDFTQIYDIIVNLLEGKAKIHLGLDSYSEYESLLGSIDYLDMPEVFSIKVLEKIRETILKKKQEGNSPDYMYLLTLLFQPEYCF